MSRPKPVAPARLIVGVLIKERSLLSELAAEMVARLGRLETVSRWWPFDYTQYYDSEMGAPLWRRFLVFKRMWPQDGLAALKLTTNRIEDRFAFKGNRRINIDPGFLVRERFVLATTKNFSQRIYLSQGIYADLTLIYKAEKFQTLPWTYPDFKDRSILEFLTMVRKKYIRDLKPHPKRTDS